MPPRTLRVPPDQDLVVFGATGDLARRKLLPALYELSSQGLLPRRGEVVGTATRDLNEEGFRQFAREAVAEFGRTALDEQAFSEFAKRLRYIPALSNPGPELAKILRPRRRIVYLAVPPSSEPGRGAAA